MAALPTIEQVVSRFLFDQDIPPQNLKDESLIRPEYMGVDLSTGKPLPTCC